MTTRTFALVLGIIFLLIGILGFVPGVTRMIPPQEGLAVHGPGHGYLLGLFHVNLLHNLVHILFGIMGIAMYRRYDLARLYARIVAISYGLLVLLGLMPAPFSTVFGLAPVHGHDVWLHLILAGAGAYFGWVVPARDMPTDEYATTGAPRR
jgi:hypothetical protein